MTTQVSVILPTYNRVQRLAQVLLGLERQTVSLNDFEVIVVSDGSTDGTDAFLKTLQTPLKLVAVTQENQGPAVARNTGVQRATSELILFIDDDVVPAPELLSEHLRMHGGQNNIVVLGPMLSPPGVKLAPWVEWEQEMLMKQYVAMQKGYWEPTARQFYTGNTSIRRQAVLDAGGFDSRFRRAEDVELAYRLARQGLRFVFNPQAVGFHYAERSFRSWIEIPYHYGRNDVTFAREGEDWIFEIVQVEFRRRNPLIRSLVGLCLDRNQLSNPVLAVFKQAAMLNNRLGLRQLTRFAHSAMFNLRYYQGVADGLGGRDQFLGLIG